VKQVAKSRTVCKKERKKYKFVKKEEGTKSKTVEKVHRKTVHRSRTVKLTIKKKNKKFPLTLLFSSL
jgi:hypothetical protein